MSRLPRPGRWVGAVLAGVVLAGAVGCGGPAHGDVNGRVTFRGRPVVSGAVSVVAADARTYYGVIQLDGTYTVRKVPVGPVKIGVYSPDPYIDPPISAEAKASLREQQQRAGMPELQRPPKGAWFRLPPRYADALKSGLTGEVTPGGVTIDCPLQ